MGVIMNPPLTSGGYRTSSVRLSLTEVKCVSDTRAAVCGQRATMTA